MPKCGNNIKTKTRPGFTIIEVVLVLAIAGLIFLMVFLALPALQRAQRDTQRRDDMARFAAQIAQYQTNNRGKVPNTQLSSPGGIWVTTSSHADVTTAPSITNPINTGDWNTFLNNYMWAANDDFTDPGGTAYAVQDHGSMTAATGPTMGTIQSAYGTISYDASTKKVTFGLTQVDFIIHVFHAATCGTSEGTVEQSASGGVRKLALVYKLEGSGYYCGEV